MDFEISNRPLYLLCTRSPTVLTQEVYNLDRFASAVALTTLEVASMFRTAGNTCEALRLERNAAEIIGNQSEVDRLNDILASWKIGQH